MPQPFRGEIQRGADREDAGVLPLHQPLGAGADVVERLANHAEVIPAGRGNLEALALAAEELDAELGLEGPDLLAHRALGDVKLLGRAGEAFVAGGGLERPECIEWRQPARHRSKLNRQNSVWRQKLWPAHAAATSLAELRLGQEFIVCSGIGERPNLPPSGFLAAARLPKPPGFGKRRVAQALRSSPWAPPSAP